MRRIFNPFRKSSSRDLSSRDLLFRDSSSRYSSFRPTRGNLGPLEQRMLDALWARGSATVRELVDGGCEDLAYTTVMTTLDRLFKKGVLTRSEEGRAFRYVARFSREEFRREAAGDALRQLLDSSPGSSLPLSFLVEILGERDAQLLEDLRKLVERKRRELSQREAERGESGSDKAGRRETE
ncbi:MAG: BlaI/MecI/CopY family transcriptional regulator [Candidatus Sulfotelmatobacter sp.]